MAERIKESELFEVNNSMRDAEEINSIKMVITNNEMN